MRVGVIAVLHESNTFLSTPTTLRDFERDVFLRGTAIQKEYGEAYHEVAGFLQGLQEAGSGIAPLMMASALPSGVITAETVAALWATCEATLDAAGPIDGLLVALHGAAVSNIERDMDGWLLTRLRERTGSDMPIICTLDPHANVSERMVQACQASITYRMNPHLDQRERGLEAAQLMARSLRGEVKPVQAASLLPMIINIERQLTSAPPCQLLQEQADRIRNLPGVLSVSVILGFPYADVREMGSGFIVVTDNDPALARMLADKLATYLWENREAFIGQFIPVEAALERASEAGKPVCLLDIGDNIGGGSPGDGTLLAHALSKQRNKSFVCLYDPEAVVLAQAAGVGKRVTLRMGGKTDTLHGPPFEAEVLVKSLHDGLFRETQPRHGGDVKFDMGTTVIVETVSNLTLMLTSQRTAPTSLQQLLSCGIRPEDFDVLVVKGVHAPVAAYQPVCPTLIRVNTPGITTADIGCLTYRNRRKPMFPFENFETWRSTGGS